MRMYAANVLNNIKMHGHNTDPGEVPQELQSLTNIKQQLIAQVHPVLSVYCVQGQRYAYSSHTKKISQDVHGFM